MDNFCTLVKKLSKLDDIKETQQLLQDAQKRALLAGEVERQLIEYENVLGALINDRTRFSAEAAAAQAKILELSRELSNAYSAYDTAKKSHDDCSGAISTTSEIVQRTQSILNRDTSRKDVCDLETLIAKLWRDVGIVPGNVDELIAQYSKQFDRLGEKSNDAASTSTLGGSTSTLGGSTSTLGGTNTTMIPTITRTHANSDIDKTLRELHAHAERLNCIAAVRNLKCVDRRREKYHKWLRDEKFITPGHVRIDLEDKPAWQTVINYFRTRWNIALEISAESSQKSDPAARWWVFSDGDDDQSYRCIGKIMFAFEDTTVSGRISVFYLYLDDLLVV